MKIEDIRSRENISIEGIASPYYLLGLISAFENRFQAMADAFMQEVSWKQFFILICINMCKTDPTIKELAEIVGSSHQNVKQLLLKLENKGFIEIYPDEADRRRQRVRMTEHCREFCAENDDRSVRIMEKMFAGITEEQMKATIDTLTMIDKNMGDVEDNGI